MSDAPEAPPTPPAEPAAAEVDADLERSARRRRWLFTGFFVAVLLLVAGILGIAALRDPGPQPTVPPKITGTDNGALKRAIVHYVGALEQRDEKAMEKLIGDDYPPRTQALARITVAEFGDSATGKASVKVANTGFGVQTATITFADGRVQEVDFSSAGPDEPWRAEPRTDRTPPEPPSDDASPRPAATGLPTGG